MLIYQRLGISERDYKDLKTKLKDKIDEINNTITRYSHEQEEHFFSAYLVMLGKIEFGDDNKYFIKFLSSQVNSRGKNSAESITGCDFGLKVSWGIDSKFEKAILGQAKNSSYLSESEQKTLRKQCEKMSKFTENYIVALRPGHSKKEEKEAEKEKEKELIIHIGKNGSYEEEIILLSDYIIDYLLSCVHGETNPEVIEYMLQSNLKELISLKTNLPKPTPEPKPTTRRKPRM
ncbi:hypothetical protein B6D12_06020 [Gilliamella apicola]|uniref:hypothetical protein n=1 Tax=Gilliamella apicola TaxID=1196095 RepID=UPI000A3534D0|nr:hypothetical protein [Gilliamella apicola]OTP90509.1 hypothetical protein B5S41_03750 [Gilliamella apicola]OTQ05719.1 hypothetical protein B6D12_06020 [Gilliamella apicola]